MLSVDFKVADKTLLEEALKSLKLKYRIDGNRIIIFTPAGNIVIVDGKAQLSEAAQPYLNQIKRAFSIKAIERVAKKYKFTTTTKPGNQYVLRRY